MKKALAILLLPLCASAEPAKSPLVTWGTNAHGDATFSVGGMTFVTGVRAEIAGLSAQAIKDSRSWWGGRPDCVDHVRTVQRLAQERGWTVKAVQSQVRPYQFHVSALVYVGERVFLLDNGALGIGSGGGVWTAEWLDLTGRDLSGLVIRDVP